MISVPGTLAQTPEVDASDAIRARYESMGFRVEHPSPGASLPDFFGTYRPDLIAVSPDDPDRKIAIEVLSAGRGEDRPRLEDLKQRFDGQDGWELRFALAPHDPESRLRLPVASAAQLEAELAAVESLAAEAQTRPAFLMAWALLEAASHAVPDGSSRRPRKPMTTIRTLGALGLIEPEDEDRLNALVPLRNMIAHGGLASVPSESDVKVVTTAIRKVLAVL